MNNRYFNQNGLTLIELLITLAIMAFVGTLVFSVFTNGIKYSNTAKTTVNLQQQANIVLAELTSWHESHSTYDITLDKNPYGSTITLIPYNGNDVKLEGQKKIISDSRFEYVICFELDQSFSSCNVLTQNIKKTQKNLPIKLIVRDKKDHKQSFEVKTILSRI
ncbi:prepilin-type N-terminal cleavage/methylation domain-containing protein [Neobacillus sp. LXY-4]|uniref:prepilin-type N-terminal cleavage/methylation domain-containing protein n=1 Tax=Neobacillus sp. LXY-4 TaxID=3379826 RepID=UPI003EE068F4